MIGRKATLAFAVSLLKNLVGFVGFLFVAHYMGREALGIVGFGFAYVGLFNFLADMGFGVAHIKKVSEGRDLSKCLGAYLTIRVVLTLLMVVAVLAGIHISRFFPNNPFKSVVHEQVTYLAIASLVLLNLGNVIGVTFAARKETAKQLLPELLGKILEAVLKTLVALAGLSVVLLAGASLASSALLLLAYALVFRGYRFARPDRGLIKDYFVFALPVTVIVSANAITEHLDQVMIQFFWDSGELGYYVGAGRLSGIFMMVGPAIGALLFPTVSSLHSQSNLSGIRQLAFRAERFIALLLFPAGVVISLFSPLIVTLLLGRPFLPSAPILVALTWMTIIFTLSVPYSSQIIGTGRERLSAMLSVVLMLLNVGLNLLFIPRSLAGIPLFGLGSYGAALAALLATSIMALLYRYFATRFTGMAINRSLFKLILAAGLMALTVYLLRSLLPGPELAVAAVAGILGVIVYVTILVLMGEFSKADVTYLTRTFSPAHMKSYVVDEFRSTKPGPAEPFKDEPLP